MRRTSIVLTLVLSASIILTTDARVWSHTLAGTEAAGPLAPPLDALLAAAATGARVPWAALALLGAAALTTLCRRRRAVPLLLVLVVALLAFETGVHSTHHLGKAEDSTRCAIAWMSAELSADIVAVSIDAPPPPAPEASISALGIPALASLAVVPDTSRAPPVTCV
jgi:hypothetical protein